MPTRRGVALAVASIVCLVAAWALGLVEFAVLGTGGVAALGLGRLTLLRPAALRVSREIAPLRVERGGDALGVVTVVNAGRRRGRAVRAVDTCGDRDIAVSVPALRPGAAYTASYFLPTGARGEIPVGPLRLTATDPMGLYRRVRSYGQPATLLVCPRTVPLAALPSGRAATVDGPASATATSGTVTFHALREYAYGDDLRHIHWRTSARTGTLMVRQLVDASLPRTVVVLDNREASYPSGDEFEVAVDVAASIAVAAARAGYPVTVLTADGRPIQAAGSSDVESVLRHLALVSACGPVDLGAVVGAQRPGWAGGALCVVSGAAETVRFAAVRAHFDQTLLVRVGSGAPSGAGGGALVVDAGDLTTFAVSWRVAVSRDGAG